MKYLHFLLVLTLPAYYVKAQNPEESEVRYLSRSGINRLANNKFGNLVTGQSNSTNLVNYAAFNPVAGSANFNGSLPIGNANDTARFSFLSFKISGDLISDSYLALFQNSKVNTNVAISGQWDFQLGKGFHFNYLGSSSFNLDQKRRAIELQYDENNRKFAEQSASNPNELNLKRIQIAILDNALGRSRDSLSNIQIYLDHLMSDFSRNADSVKIVNDSLLRKRNYIEQLEKNRWNIVVLSDSLQNLIANNIGFILATQGKIDEERESKLRLLEDSAVITGIKFNWISLVASTGRKNYYTFNPLEVFSNQIQKLESNPWKFGIMYNYYSERSFPRRVFLGNIGVFRYADNNLSLLSTKDISQENVITNAAGDTTRKISKTYKSYTDEVIHSKVWNFTGNIYLLYSSKKSGFHVYPSVDVYDKGKTLVNLGLGYLISFKNTEKDKPIINAEGYIQFQDMANELERKNGFYNRNEIGVRFSLPFTFFN